MPVSAEGHDVEARAEEIVAMLSERMSRDQVAESLGYTGGYRSLHMFMSRRGFVWDKARQNYFRDAKPKSGVVVGDSRASDKAARVIDLFGQGMDGKEIAKVLKFLDLREMSSYMASRDYAWCQEAGNYSRETDGDDDISPPEPVFPGELAQIPAALPEVGAGNFDHYLPLLEFLDQHSEALVRLIDASHQGGQSLPRYAIPGRCITKSVHMTTALDQLIRDFSEEKNVSQRELFEVAMVEFFRKYGFAKEVDALLK